jgi:hypothetical protein
MEGARPFTRDIEWKRELAGVVPVLPQVIIELVCEYEEDPRRAAFACLCQSSQYLMGSSFNAAELNNTCVQCEFPHVGDDRRCERWTICLLPGRVRYVAAHHLRTQSRRPATPVPIDVGMFEATPAELWNFMCGDPFPRLRAKIASCLGSHQTPDTILAGLQCGMRRKGAQWCTQAAHAKTIGP